MMHLAVHTSLVGLTLVALIGWATAVRATAGQQKPLAAAEQHEHAAEHDHPAAAGPHEHAAEKPAAAGHDDPVAGTPRHVDAAALKNPIAADDTSIAAGKMLFTSNCASCHGDAGLGDGKMGEKMNVKPANLTDANWKHGSTDGEIYTVIHDGIKTAGMQSFSPKLTENQIWDLVNYVRSIGPAKSH